MSSSVSTRGLLRRSRVRAAIVLACSCSARLAGAASPASEPSWPNDSMLPGSPGGDGRRRVLIGVVGSERLEESDRRALSGLLAAERGASSLTHIEEIAPSGIGPWIAATERDETVRLSAVLDTRSRRVWELYLVDALRGRAIRRRLPLDREGTPAALESAASVILSAVRALEEGLEIASAPVDAVLPADPRTADEHVDHAVTETESAAPDSARLLRGSVSAVVTAFERSVPFTSGAAAGVGVSLVESVTLRLGVAQYLPAQVESALGDFEVLRTTGVLSVGRMARLAAWELEAELGAATELLRRRRTASTAAAEGRPGSNAVRAGPALGARVRFRLSSWCALEWASSAVYYFQPVEYVVAPLNSRHLAVPWQFVVGTQLGLELTFSTE